MSYDPDLDASNGAAIYNSTPFGGDDNTKSHIQDESVADVSKVLPGEQPDPRLC